MGPALGEGMTTPAWFIAGAEREMVPNGFGINPSDVTWRNKGQRVDFLVRYAAYLADSEGPRCYIPQVWIHPDGSPRGCWVSLTTRAVKLESACQCIADESSETNRPVRVVDEDGHCVVPMLAK
jgi:hypothetical protein